MKHWLIAALICFGSTQAKAAQEVYSSLFSTATYKTVSVSTITPTALFAGTLQGATTDFYDIMRNRKLLRLQNVDGSTTTFVSCTVDVSSNLPAGYLSANEIEYSLHPASSPFAGTALPPVGLNPTFFHDIALAPTNGSLYLVPWCLCYGNGKAASACNVQVTQYGF